MNAFVKTGAYLALIISCLLSTTHAQPKKFPLGVNCSGSTNGTDCYNCVTRQCGNLHPSGTYTNKTAYKECIDQSLNICDTQFPKIRNPARDIIKKLPPNLKDSLFNTP